MKSEFKSQSICPQSPCFCEFIKRKVTITLLKQELHTGGKVLRTHRNLYLHTKCTKNLLHKEMMFLPLFLGGKVSYIQANQEVPCKHKLLIPGY